MKRALVIWSRVVLAGALAASPVAATPPPLPHFPPLQFHPPKPERVVLPNGMTLFLLEDHELPLIHVGMIARAGSQYDAPSQLGLSSLFGEVMTEGGSASYTPEEIEKVLDRTAASVGFSVSLESTDGSLQCRTKDSDAIFKIFADLLMHPQFRADRIEVARGKALEGLRRMNDEPEEMARREFRRFVYGSDHPYARIPSPKTLASLTRADFVNMHEKYFHPNAVILAVSGDFSSVDMRRQIETAFRAWPKADVLLPTIPTPRETPAKEIGYIDWPVNQSQIRTGSLGFARHNPDHFAWEVFNELWGGSGTSWLFRTVRTQQGLAYSVGSAYSEPAQAGLIVAISETRGPETVEAAQSMLNITEQVSHAPFSADEVKEAKDSIINRFVENYSSSARIVDDEMNYEYFGFPADYLSTYTQHVAAVSEDDLKRVGRLYLHPETFKTLIVGDVKSFKRPLSTLGSARPVEPLDYSKGE